jgi:hypothetical protein
MSRRFALDQNFPEPFLGLLSMAVPEAELVPLRLIDARLVKDTEDWQILHALHHHSGGWDGMITMDSSMLRLPRELSVLKQTKLTLVVPEKAGNDPIRATGLLMTHLPNICKNTSPALPQLWVISAVQRSAVDPWEHLAKLAERAKVDPLQFFEKHKLSEEDLLRNPLG